MIKFASYLHEDEEFFEIWNEVFPNLWSASCTGEENLKKLKKIGQLARCFMILMVSAILASCTSGLPWYDRLDKWALPFNIFFYVSFYHIGLTIVCNAIVLMYLVLHLYSHCFLINKILENLANSFADLNPVEAIIDKKCQIVVTKELISCTQHHQKMIRYKNRYIFTSADTLFRTFFEIFATLLMTVSFCFLGKLLKNEYNAERIPVKKSYEYFLYTQFQDNL
ncbi:hypothetical protein BDFB_012311, partial [Asbolus verrucosus]